MALELEKDTDRRLVILMRQSINVAIIYEGSGRDRMRATYYARDDGKILARIAEPYPEGDPKEER